MFCTPAMHRVALTSAIGIALCGMTLPGQPVQAQASERSEAIRYEHRHHPAADVEEAGYEDYRTTAGRLVDGVLTAALVARPAAWRPWGPDGPALDAHVFAEDGAAAKVPGPMLRVTAGTPVHLTLRNLLGDTLLVRGLRDRGQQLPPGTPPGPALVSLPFVGDSVVVAPDGIAEVRFTPTVPGSYFYFGKTVEPGWSDTPQPLFGADAADRGLVGVLIVDDPDEPAHPDERIFLITHWADREIPASWLPSARFMINGRSWPHTERLVYAQGDTVRWRVINQSGAFHPMHLHGFYFHVDEWTAQTGMRLPTPVARPFVVTWPLPVSAAVRLSWVAHEPGNWVFHCHLMRHMSWIQHPPAGDGASSHHPDHETREGVDLMGGLVLGVTVQPAEGFMPLAETPRRRLRLHIGMRPDVFDGEPAYGFVLQEGPDAPAPDSVRFPGSPIVLTRGEPTEIVVHNHADVPLGVHWHGLELESRGDGVPGWSGTPDNPVPAITPGDSLVVRMTPPRAGTFMYHVHSEPGHQLAQGLYGPFLVLEPDEPWDRDTDRLFLLGSLGAGEDAPPAVNGRLDPGPMEFRAGTTYRLRFMHISPDDNKTIRLLDGDEPVEWQFVARDGADLPPGERPVRRADIPLFDVGTTFDVVWTPAKAGEYTLRIITTFDPGLPAFPRDAPPPDTQDIPIDVEAAPRALATDSAAVMDTLERFLHSFNHLEWETFRGHFHDDATVFQPLPTSPRRNDGRAALEAVFSGFFDAMRRGGTGPPYLRIQPLDLRLQTMGDAAVATFHLETPDPSVLGRRTLVLRRDGDRWLIVHLHASLATAPSDPPAATQSDGIGASRPGVSDQENP